MINCNYKWMITRASMGYPNDWNLKNIHPRHHRRVREGRPFHLETGKIHVFTGGRSAIQHVVFTVFTMRKKGGWNQERCGFTRLYPSTWVQLLHQENCCFSDHNWWLMILHDGHKPHQPGEQQSLTSPSNLQIPPKNAEHDESAHEFLWNLVNIHISWYISAISW